MGLCFLDLLRSNKMYEPFYTELQAKIENIDDCVRDIIKYIERHRSTHDYALDRRLINEYLISILESSLTRGFAKLSRIHTFTEDFMDNISDTGSKLYATYDSFIVFGCPESSDIDIVVFVPDNDSHDGKTKELSQKSINEIRRTLSTIGYDERDMDITTACVCSGRIIGSSKGGAETQNIILATWKYHKQIMASDPVPLALYLHPIDWIEFSESEIFDKLRAFAKYVLDYAEDIVPVDRYKIFRPIKKEIYAKGGDHMMILMRDILQYTIHDPEQIRINHMDQIKYHNHYKALVMKLIQIITHNKYNIISYSKKTLVDDIKLVFDDYKDADVKKYRDGAEWFLFRGTRGEYCSELFPKLLTIYHGIVDVFLAKYHVDPVIFSRDTMMRVQLDENILTITQELFEMFIASPNICTEAFEQKWKTIYCDESINEKFQIISSDGKEFFDHLESLGICIDVIQLFKHSFIFLNQRSPEWLDMLANKFVCGSNAANINLNSFQGSYNLIRGSIIELLAIRLFDPDKHFKNNGSRCKFMKLNLGFIVESDTVGAKGFAPDLVLIGISDHAVELILVEIKGLHSLQKNSDYYRGLSLARHQVQSARQIFSNSVSNDRLIIQRGIIILCCIKDERLIMEIHDIVLDLKN
jgi:hypothetical protein